MCRIDDFTVIVDIPITEEVEIKIINSTRVMP